MRSSSSAPPGRLRRYLLLGKWALVDQGLSSGTNFLLAIVAVRSLPAGDFGAFSIAALLYVIALGVTRALTTEPLAIRFGRDVRAIRAGAPSCLGLTVALGTVGALACIVTAVAAGGTLGSVFVVLGLTLPFLVVQDAGRVICFAMGAPRRAAANDALWALVQVPLVVAIVRHDHAPTSWYVAAWLVPGALAGLLMLYQLTVLPSLRRARGWFVDHRRLGVPLLWNYVLTTAPPYLLFAVTPIVASLSELGLARAAYLPYGVFGVVFQSAWLALVPMASRRTAPEMSRLAIWSSTVLAGLALAWSVFLVLVLPSSVGVTLFGASWDDMRVLHVLFGAALIAQAAGVGPMVGLRALEVPKLLVRVRLVTSPIMLVGGLLLTARFGATGLVSAILFGDVSTTALSWALFRRSNRAHSMRPAVGLHHERVGHVGDTASDPPAAVGVDPSLRGTVSP